MVNLKLMSQGFNGLVDEVCSLITHKDLWASKSGYDILKNELCNFSCTTILNYSCFYPSGQRFYSSDNVSSSCVLS
jgi:hypothetical protein